MRSTKELLEVLAYEYEYEYSKDRTVRDEGLCWAIKRLTEYHGVFTVEEKEKLDAFIYEHRPDITLYQCEYWWDTGKVYPRVKFLQKLISKL